MRWEDLQEALAQIPREKWPSFEELERITESRYESDPDYVHHRNEIAIWISDYWRDEEKKRKSADGSQPMLGHETMGDSVGGFEEENFNIGLLKEAIRRNPLH